ncbi:sodium-coupled monocarboxylate transporter 1 [Nephila pilipes]|uniref:Sodium-coupled monocarboxylate transporter 1 n=1 Tax=Nephila pilipes TaxID=299642 RepID=A0A8X6TIX0_NEPPI|nr:sodium-coupled monocarboxylate transporter 1 [Nephila pilipes]
MKSEQHLGTLDYVIITISLLIPSVIGIVFRFSGGRQKTMNEYFLAGRNASKLPVIMSITATTLSSVFLIGAPAEVYRFGPLYCLFSVSVSLSILIVSRIIIPVYFQCNVSSIYELLEIRFGKLTRFTVSALFAIQMVLYSSCVLYGPALVLNAVTGMSVEAAITLCGGICTFYCFLGGLKAVLWTDVFQTLLMFMSLFALHFTGIQEVSFGEIYRRTSAGGRLNFFDFSLDLTTRNTVWNTVIRGIGIAFGIYGTNQIQIQRLLSMNGCKNALSALHWSSIPIVILLCLAALFGLTLYSVFYLCDPILNESAPSVTKYDQLVPYFIITRLQSIPGLSGLCVAGIFSGSLSTISSSLNSVSMVTVVDFVQPFYPRQLKEKTLLFIGKALALLYGIIFILMACALSKADSIIQLVMVFIGVAEGPITAVFLIGVLTRKGSDRVAMLSLLFGFGVASWIGFGGVLSGYRQSSLPLETSGCIIANTSMLLTENKNSSCLGFESCSSTNFEEPVINETFFLYKISSYWISSLGCLFTVCATFILVLITGWRNNVIPADSKCLSPISRYWLKQDVTKQRSSRNQEVTPTADVEEKESKC